MDLIIRLKQSVLELFWKTQLVFTVHNNIIAQLQGQRMQTVSHAELIDQDQHL